MKKIIIVSLFLLLMPTVVLAEDVQIAASIEGEELLVFVDDKQVNFPDQEPFIDENNRTMIPVRFPTEAFGAEVDWVQEEQKVVTKNQDREVKMWIDNNIMEVNGEEQEMDTTPIIKNDRTVVPTRFIAEALGVDVDYERVSYIAEDDSEIVSDNIGIVFNFTEDQLESEIEQLKEDIMTKVKDNLPEIEVPEDPADAHPALDDYNLDYEVDKKYIDELGHEDTTLHEPNELQGLSAYMFYDGWTEEGRQDAARILNRRLQDMDKVNEIMDYVENEGMPQTFERFETDSYTIRIASDLLYIYEK
ncbi:copper amine oxidase N-terminal domain-containing protein [Natranaerofaba carboxydovora]|uniref:copper amine oxidase N-terminal domain-containing protein n=1 Tax=Natranaerofaba carboxydovora TaxID=2742683 RepID=UPI001F13EED4|nr:copper amine oxidase N-terminal domain-containing protein [Natranaerofaba carboxydovora]UMZ72991.1 hypothetical protein ACONDI_00533 [Natranaerofaba carboxydovora]